MTREAWRSTGWRRRGAWSPRAVGDDRCVVHRVVDASPAFPFPHEVEVGVRVRPDGGVEVVTTLTAAAGAPVPVAFGWHPYLLAPGPRAAWELGLPARTRLVQDDAGLPTGATAAEPPERAPLGDRRLDDEFAGAGATTWSIGPLAVEQDAGYPVAHVFAPGDRAVVSLEPMTAPADALRTGAGLRVLAPGERHTAAFTLRVLPGRAASA